MIYYRIHFKVIRGAERSVRESNSHLINFSILQCLREIQKVGHCYF